MTTATAHPFDVRTDGILAQLDASGQYKRLRMLASPMGPVVKMRDEDGTVRERLCFCSNNYLGLANHPEVVEAGIEGLRKYGAGTASVRFICGTFEPHEIIEQTIAKYMGTESSYTFVSCWNASEALFPTFCESGDIIISDELNHACIIDSMRLTPTIKKGVKKGVFKHSDMDDCRARLEAARSDPDITGQIWVVTDGVFSMEGDIAKLPELRALCDEFGALLVVDDSHGHGVLGKTGRGVHEHYDMVGQVDYFTGTLGKGLGGGAGGFIAGPKRGTELIIQRGRPTLFSNALPVTVACSANKAIEILMREPQRVQKLRDNTAYARKKIGAAGLEVLESPTAICPIIVGDTAKAIAMSRKLLDYGVFVIGFGYPVVPEGTARLRIQISAAHEREHLDQLVDALKKL
ncbi:MAG: aminotransferase class I/II-fold pyridoxal phosphate-dependent enzyme [Phycisphaerales bacterium JB039]